MDDQVKYIKEYIEDFNNNNKEYYNSLKISDNLYKKYIGFFKNGKLIKPIYNIEEFNEVIKNVVVDELIDVLDYNIYPVLELKKHKYFNLEEFLVI